MTAKQDRKPIVSSLSPPQSYGPKNHHENKNTCLETKLRHMEGYRGCRLGSVTGLAHLFTDDI